MNHIALAVPDLETASRRYRDALGAAVGEPVALPEHGVTVAFVDPGGTRVELLEPLGEQSPIAPFLAKHPKGGMHHICYEVADIAIAVRHLQQSGARVLGEPKIGAHGNPVIFVHPGDFDGTLIELEEVRSAGA